MGKKTGAVRRLYGKETRMENYLTYEAFGAVGDGVADDLPAICRTHRAANESGTPVRATPGATYFVGGRNLTAEIRTDTDWTDAVFLVDDRYIEDRGQHIFAVLPTGAPYPLAISSLKKGQKQLPLAPQTPCFVTVKDENVRQFIRRGINRNQGSPKTDSFVLEKDGTVKNTIVWDFDHISEAVAYPIDEAPLTVTGGTFRRVANPGVFDPGTLSYTNQYQYHNRGILIARSHTTLRGVTFTVEGEGEHGAPYGGDIQVVRAAYVTVEDCRLTGHKLYWTDRNGGKSPMGTYGISVTQAAFVALRRLSQNVDIMDRSRWGVMGSNFGKDLLLEDCVMSRFDAHQGVTGCTIRRCRLGWQCLNAIGFGTFLIEDSEAFGHSLFNLREDYGSFWCGDLIIRHCRWIPAHAEGSVIGARNDGTHNFGYPTMMPGRVDIDGLEIDVSAQPTPPTLTVFPDYEPADAPAEKPFPYLPTREVTLKNIHRTDGAPVPLFTEPSLYPDLKIHNM